MNASQSELLMSFLEEWHSKKKIKVFTSGSTGKPKEINLNADQMVRSAVRTNNFFEIKRSSHLHCAISFEYIGGKMMIVRSLVAGCNLTFSEPSLKIQLPADDNKIDLMSVVPAQMPYILEHPEIFNKVKTFLIGGSPIDPRLWKRIDGSGLCVYESYGMTETASHVALRRIKGDSDKRPRFVPLPGVKVKADPEGRIHIFDNDLIFSTNDVTSGIKQDGSFDIAGRMDMVINTGGIKVNPMEVEVKIREYIEDLISEFIIGSVPDEIWSSRIILLIIPRKGYCDRSNKLISEVTERLNAIPEDILSRWKRPKEIRIVDTLPLTPSGKPIRNFKSFLDNI